MHRVDLGESFPTSIYLQNLASIQPRTSLVKFARSPRTDPPGILERKTRAGVATAGKAVLQSALAADVDALSEVNLQSIGSFLQPGSLSRLRSVDRLRRRDLQPVLVAAVSARLEDKRWQMRQA